MIREIVDTYPLSPMQEGMLFNSLIAPDSGVDIEQIVFVLREPLQAAPFREAWEWVVMRHAVLRTSFRLDSSGPPFQEVHAEVELPYSHGDWSGCSPEGLKANLQACVREDRRRGFHPEHPPLLRIRVFTAGESEHYVIWTFHHALLDGRSIPIVIKEVFGRYEALCGGKTFAPEQPRHFRAYIDWVGSRDHNQAEPFWREYLKGFAAPTTLVRESAPPPALSDGAAIQEFETALSGELTRALRSLAEREGLTPNTFVQGAWALLLGRYSGTDDVVFGATRACRHVTVAGSEHMVGVFMNTLPVRAKIPPGMQLLPWLKDLRASQVPVRNVEHTPLVLVQRWSEVQAGEPLFRSIVVFDNRRLNSYLRSEGGTWLNRALETYARTNYPLTLSAFLEDRLALRLVYDDRQFAKETIVRMGGHLSALLEGMVSDPHLRLSGYSLLPAAERETILTQWNGTEAPYPRDRCLHELIEEQAGRTSGAVAVEFEGMRLSYGELEFRSNRVARALASFGVGPEALVGICMEHSLEMVVGILGVLKAGGAYVPMNPADPAERLGFVRRETGMRVILTQRNLVSRIPDGGAALLCLDDPLPASPPGTENSRPASGVCPGNAAYVIYTSGSTGTPKGVVVLHRGVVNYVSWAARAYGFSPGEVTPVHSSLSFDLTVTGLFVPLVTGGKVLLLREEPGIRTLESALRERGNFGPVKITPAHLDVLSALLPPDAMAGRTRMLVVGGEELRTGSIAPWQASAPDTTIVNEYGPTEGTVGCCTFSVPPGWRGSGTVPIGRPIANTQLYILDPWMNPVPALVPGELYIGGDGVAREYLRRPDLTSERFIENPLEDAPKGKLFRTGDRARYAPDGTIEYLGRFDRQAKIRGYRVEPGEIESVLCRAPGIAEAVVLVREDAPGDRRLVAYCRGVQGSRPDTAGIVSFLNSRLPAYMVPSSFVILDRFPLTPNGKIDFKALPAPDTDAVRQKTGGSNPPDTAAEKALAGIWCEVLNLKSVGVDENFFELGGHSLLATRIVSRVRNTWMIEMPFVSIFEHPTVGGMASVLEQILASESGGPAGGRDGATGGHASSSTT
jgi:amino acid adenylation domain-containing protein